MRTDELKKESKRWEQEGIISADQRNRLLAMYPEKVSSVGGLVFAGLGALLIGAGIILVFAFNWGRMPVPLKLFIAFIPLLSAIAYAARTILRRYSSGVFRETAGIFLAMGIYSALALIGQTFHSNRELPEFVLACSIMILPCAYLLKSLGASAIYCAGAIYSCWEQPEWAAFLICAVIVPFFIIRMILPETHGQKVRRRGSSDIEYKFSLSSTLLLFSAILVNLILLIFLKIKNNGFEPLSIALFCIEILLLLDIVVMRFVHNAGDVEERFVFLSPPRVLSLAAFLVIFLISAASSESFLHHNYSWYRDEGYTAFQQISIVMIIFAAAYFVAGFVKLSRKGDGEEGVIFGSLARHGKYSLKLIRRFDTADLYFIFCLALQLSIPNTWIPSNVMLFALGIYYILLGGKKLRLQQLNFGMLLVIYLIVLRFFDMDLSLLQRGIAFIILGIAFLACNVLIFRKKKGQEPKVGSQ